MDHTRKKSIHQQMMMRRSSRSEYKDELLRHNQRHENRLALELDQWEKAQRTVARGLDKESQWFKQNAASSIGLPKPRKNSITDPKGDGAPCFIPDYQFRNRSTFMAQTESEEEQHQSVDTLENDVEKKSADQTDSPSFKSQHKKHSKASLEGEGKKGSSRQDEDKKSSRKSSKHLGERESRVKEEESKRESDKFSVSGVLSEKKPSSKTDASGSKHNHSSSLHSSTGNDKPKNSTKYKKNQTTDTTSTMTTIPTTTAQPDTTITTTITDNASTDETTRPSKTSSGARAFSICADVHDPGDVFLTPRLTNDLAWDGRRRYTNVWDTLSAPKNSNQVRSVRSRLQREFTQLPGDGRSIGFSSSTSSKGLTSSRKSGKAPSLT